jgi:hypothetical protein
MAMRIKNTEWINFKSQFIEMVEVLIGESDKFNFPIEDDNFEVIVDGCEVHPVFTKKPDFLKVEYDFSLCNTQIRTLSCSIYKDAGRIEVTLKNEEQVVKNLL